MTPLETLKALMATREEALSRAKMHLLKATNDPFAANCFDIADAALVKAMRNALPDLLALSEAAMQAADRGRHQGDGTVSVPLQCMDALRAALSRLTTTPQKDA